MREEKSGEKQAGKKSYYKLIYVSLTNNDGVYNE